MILGAACLQFFAYWWYWQDLLENLQTGAAEGFQSQVPHPSPPPQIRNFKVEKVQVSENR